jgi:hypothetical protein
MSLPDDQAADNPVNELFQPVRLRNDEVEALEGIARNFDSFPLNTRAKLENFPNWVRHRDLARFLYKAEIYQSILKIPGVIFECGVLYGGSLATWLHLGEIYEPVNYGRRVYGFDTFSGFPAVTDQDRPADPRYPELYQAGTYSAAEAEKHIFELFPLLDRTRKIPQLPRMRLVKGDVTKTVPEVLAADRSILISMLYLDLDLYEPTLECIKACLPRMPKGSVICIDELCYEDWPGETAAVLDAIGVSVLTIERSPIVPNIGVIRL